MDFNKYYKKELKEIMKRDIKEGDGIKEEVLSAAVNSIKITPPRSLKDYYLVGGNLPLNKEHNILYSPEELRYLGDYLLFAEENQRVVIWGIKRSELCVDDPMVYQGHENDDIKWYPEDKTLSLFIIDMWRWQRKLPPYH